MHTAGVLLRPERAGDEQPIGRIHGEAFRSPATPDDVPTEVALVEQLRASDAWIPALSLVAVIDGQVVGHVVCTRANVDTHAALALGPIAVEVARQNSGIGKTLIEAVVAQADALGESLICLVGSTDYYNRLGFVPSTELGIEPPDATWGDHFQARPLTAYDSAIKGRFRYARPFGLV
ncbi:MAG: N-acetyltransferase [Acidimicrobiia bacterium]